MRGRKGLVNDKTPEPIGLGWARYTRKLTWEWYSLIARADGKEPTREDYALWVELQQSADAAALDLMRKLESE